jgi:hypothetical protein
MRNVGIARLAVAAGMSFAAMTSMLPTIPAMADVSYGTGSIVINKVDGNGDVTYDGYQIFKANVTDDTSEDNATGKTETNVAWANDDVKTAVENLIKSKDANYAGKTAEDAATYISGKITKTDNTTRVDAASFANELAKAVDGKASTTSVTPGTAATIGEGYWLFVTNTATDSKTNAVGTAPIFAVVGGKTKVTVTEKTSVPTVSKQVKNDATGAGFTSVADAEAGQSISYKLTGTVADNVATYDTYKYAFSDALSTGLVADADSVKVSVDGKEISTDSYEKNYDTGKNILSVSFANLKAAKTADGSTVPITDKSKVVVDYTAHLDPTKAVPAFVAFAICRCRLHEPSFRLLSRVHDDTIRQICARKRRLGRLRAQCRRYFAIPAKEGRLSLLGGAVIMPLGADDVGKPDREDRTAGNPGEGYTVHTSEGHG